MIIIGIVLNHHKVFTFALTMKILFISDNFFPEVNAPATRTHQHCREWVKKGAEVTVITCVPNFPQGKVFDGYKNRLYQKEVIDGITVIRVWSYIAANKGFYKRTLDFISFAFMAFWAGLFRKTDIIVATSPQFFTAICGCFLSIFKRKPWIMEVRDLWPESILAVGAMQKGFIYNTLERIEMFLYKKAARIVVVTDKFKQNLINRSIDGNKIHVVKNGVLLDEYQPASKDETLLKDLKLEDKFVFTYLGTHGMAHKLDFIVESAAKLDHRNDIHFLFIGDGAEKKNLLKLKEKLQLNNVTFHPFVAKSVVKKFISITDVALVCLKKSDTFKSVIPSKIFENAAMHRPVLLGVDGESREIIESYNAGMYFEPENEKDFLAKVVEFENDQDAYKTYQNGCQLLAEDFNRCKLADNMYEIASSVINKNSNGQAN